MVWRNLLLVSLMVSSWINTLQAQEPPRDRRMCVVLGAAGESQYGEAFRTWGSRWQQAATDFDFTKLDGTDDTQADDSLAHRDAIMQWISAADSSVREHWLIFIGHGTHDAKTTRFNLKGPDISAIDLGKSLNGKPGKWVLIFCSSASAPFLSAVSGIDRVVITATKSGSEENYSRFGDFLSQSLSDTGSDLDHDRSLSVLELFLAASRRVEKYYAEQGLLATEQALIDDNGDSRGTPAVFYRGLRAVKSPAEGAKLDGEFARRTFLKYADGKGLARDLEERIAEIEQNIEELRKRKSEMDVDAYYQELEQLLVVLARELGR
jgi:hypothetical protein